MFIGGLALLIAAGIRGAIKNSKDYNLNGEKNFLIDYTTRERFSALKYLSVLLPYIVGLILLFGSFIYAVS